MKPWIALRSADLDRERREGADEDVHFTEGLVEAVVGEYTDPGDLVLDPFAGYGTTLVVAERMGRRAVGIELLDERAELVRSRLGAAATVIAGDSRVVGALIDEPVALCMTSPPYMTMTDHPENPLNAYETLDGDYATYLDEIGGVFKQVAELLRPGGHAVLNVANISHEGMVTPLAWDIARVVSQHLTFERETFLCWDSAPEWLTGDYALVFRR